jgi:hypothetical protein
MEPTERTLESVMKVRAMMKELLAELRNDVKVLADPQARAIFETAVQSIDKSLKAMLAFEQKNLPDLNAPTDV